MKIIPCAQGSPEWITARLGKVTASEADALVSPHGKIRTGAGPTSFLYRKVAEKVLGFSLNDASSFAMNQGSIVETEAIPWYSFDRDVKVHRVGFCVDDTGRFGFSPDGLVGEDGGVEVKSPQPAQHLQYFMEGVVPDEYRLQVQFSLFVSRRAWWDFVSYSRQFPALVVRSEPEPRIQEAIGTALTDFLARFDAVLAKITAMKNAELARKTELYHKTDPDYLAWAAKQGAAS